MNAAELALLADPKALLAYASSIVNMILNGEISADVTVSTELTAHTAHPAPAEAPAQPAAVPAPEAPEPEVTITRLGTNPVVSDADLTPAEKEAIEKGKFSKVEKGFQDTTDNDINDSPIEKSARAAAMKFFNGDVEEVERYMTWLHENKQYFIDGSKTPIVDGVGYNKDGFKDVEIVDGEAVMGERNGGAKEVKLVFDKPEQATRGVYVTSGGESVNSDVYDTCGNPQLSMAEPEKPAPAPAPDTCAEGPKDKVDVKLVEGSTPSAKPIPIATVERTGLKPGEMWNDDGDGRAWQNAHSLDRGDEFPGLPDRAQIDKDIAEFKAKYGGEPPYIVYTLVDCDGNSVVVCYNTDKHSWNVFSDNTWDQNKDGRVTLDESIIDTKEELDAYLKDNAVKPK